MGRIGTRSQPGMNGSHTLTSLVGPAEPTSAWMEATPEPPHGAGRSGSAEAVAEPRHGLRQNPVVWVTTLFVATFLLQRISVPGISIPVTLPLAVLWIALAWLRGVVTVDPTRLLIWMAAAGVSGAMVLPQLLFVASPYVSFNSWALWMVIWLPLVVRLQRRSRVDYVRTLRAVAHVGLGIAALSLLFLVLELLGIRYVDWVAEFVPQNLLVQDFNVTYPIAWGSTIYKSNAWLALEPSFLSFMLGACLLAALITRMSAFKAMLLLAGLLSTLAGSGLALVGGYLVGLVVVRRIGALRKYAVPSALLIVGYSMTGFAGSITQRVSEGGDSRSSTALRATEPYVQLWPHWVADPVGILVGQGAGSSAEIVRSLAIQGLLVPNVAKVLFDYGLIGGVALIILMIVTYLRGPEPLFALTLAGSMFVLQSASQPLVICSVMLVTLWSPAVGPPLRAHSRPSLSPPPSRRQAQLGRGSRGVVAPEVTTASGVAA
jgi:hypothetical protein